jgi:hypothetical protein
MRTARALVASVGTSIVLVAAVTLSLLSVSAVFAIGGFDGGDDGSSNEALVLDVSSRRDAVAADARPSATPVVLRTPKRQPAHIARNPAHAPQSQAHHVVTRTQPATVAQVPSAGSGSTSAPQPRPAPSATKAASKPNLGDGVRELGDNLGTTVQEAGGTLAQATAPLGPPLSVAVQQVLNLVAALVNGTTKGIGDALGSHP